MIDVAISSEMLDAGAAVEAVRDHACGGIGLFLGTVRSGSEEGPVVALEYDAHPVLAEARMSSIAQAAAERWDVRHIFVRHRSGRCAPGEPTVLVACSAPHRADALDSCRYIIDALKTEVPVWKKEIFEDSSRWVEAR